MSKNGGIDSDRGIRGWGKVFLFSAFGIVSVSMVVLIGLSIFVPPMMDDMVEAYTVAEPVVLPVVDYTDEEKEALEVRLESFTDALGSDTAVDSIGLSEEELNILVSGDETDSKIYLRLRDGGLVAELSIPLENDLEIGPWRSSMQGRYINGIATLNLEIRGDMLAVDLVSFRVKGKLVPNWLERVLQWEIDALDWLDSDDVREVVGRLDTVSVDNGQLVLEPRRISER